MSATRPRLTRGGAAAGGARHRLPRLLRVELPRRDDRRRSRARPGSASRSSTATSARSATSTSPASTRRGARSASSPRRRSPRTPARCLGAIADGYMTKRGGLRLVDLWIQALTEASDDPAIAKAVRRQIREVHDFFADVIRRGQEAGVIHRRPRPGRRGVALHRRRPARDDRPPPRRPARRRPRARARLAPSPGWHAPSRLTEPPETKEPRLRHPGLFLVRRGALSRRPRKHGSAAQPRLRSMCLGAPLALRPGVRSRCKVASL